MSIDAFDDDFDFPLQLSDWLKSSEASELQKQLEVRIMNFLFSHDPRDVQFQQMVAQLAWLGAEPTKKAFLARDITELKFTPEKIELCKGIRKKAKHACKKVSKFIAAHKEEILIGAAICATGLAIAVVTGYTASVVVGGVVVTGANSIFSQQEDKPNLHIPQTTPLCTQQDLAALQNQPSSLLKVELPPSLTELFITADGIWANGQFFPNNPLRSSSFSETLTSSYLYPLPSNITTPEPLVFRFESTPPATPPEAISSTSSLLSNLPNLPPPIGIFPSPAPWTDPHNAVLSGPLTPTESDSAISKKYSIAGKIGPHYIGWINGVANSFDDFKTSGHYIQKLAGGSLVSGIYNHSHTIVIDLLEAACLNHGFGFSPVTAKLLQKEWQDFHEYNIDRPNAKALQICHSQGAIHVKNALQNCPLEIQDRVIVIAIAPGAIVPDKLCFKAYNYASEKDIVYKFEPSRPTLLPGVIDDVLIPRFGEPILPARDELILLPSHPDSKGIDHEFQSLTFRPIIEKVLEHYTERQGQYLPEEKGTHFLSEDNP